MADPLSLTASIVAVIQISGVILKTLGDLKDSTRDLTRLKIEIDSIRNILIPALERLKGVEGDKEACDRLLGAEGLLEEFRLQLQQLEKKLTPVSGFNKARRAVAWKFKQPEVKSILGTIERQKSLFVLVLQSETYIMSQNTQDLCNQNHEGITKLHKSVTEVQEVQQAQQSNGPSCSTTSINGVFGQVVHYGNNYGASNVVYGGTQIFTGATICFGTA